MTRKKLPIGIQTFRKIRQDDCYYVDKTGYAQQLVTPRPSFRSLRQARQTLQVSEFPRDSQAAVVRVICARQAGRGPRRARYGPRG